MTVLITYDSAAEHCPKIHKLLCQYLIWQQNSVFEGEITEGNLKELRYKLTSLNLDNASIICYHLAAFKKEALQGTLRPKNII
jgi:CRISPR-associated protein Cas2